MFLKVIFYLDIISICNNKSNKYELHKIIIIDDITLIKWKSIDYTYSSNEMIA